MPNSGCCLGINGTEDIHPLCKTAALVLRRLVPAILGLKAAHDDSQQLVRHVLPVVLKEYGSDSATTDDDKLKERKKVLHRIIRKSHYRSKVARETFDENSIQSLQQTEPYMKALIQQASKGSILKNVAGETSAYLVLGKNHRGNDGRWRASGIDLRKRTHDMMQQALGVKVNSSVEERGGLLGRALKPCIGNTQRNLLDPWHHCDQRKMAIGVANAKHAREGCILSASNLVNEIAGNRESLLQFVPKKQQREFQPSVSTDAVKKVMADADKEDAMRDAGEAAEKVVASNMGRKAPQVRSFLRVSQFVLCWSLFEMHVRKTTAKIMLAAQEVLHKEEVGTRLQVFQKLRETVQASEATCRNLSNLTPHEIWYNASTFVNDFLQGVSHEVMSMKPRPCNAAALQQDTSLQLPCQVGSNRLQAQYRSAHNLQDLLMKDQADRAGFVWPQDATLQARRTSSGSADSLHKELKSLQGTLEKIIKQVHADDFGRLSDTYDKLARMEAWHRNTSMQVLVVLLFHPQNAIDDLSCF
jgi:hypothetical protein